MLQKKGIITKEMEIVSEKEKIDVEVLRERIAKGASGYTFQQKP